MVKCFTIWRYNISNKEIHLHSIISNNEQHDNKKKLMIHVQQDSKRDIYACLCRLSQISKIPAILACFATRMGYLWSLWEQKNSGIVSNLIHRPPTTCYHKYTSTHILKSSTRHPLGNIGDCLPLSIIQHSSTLFCVQHVFSLVNIVNCRINPK